MFRRLATVLWRRVPALVVLSLAAGALGVVGATAYNARIETVWEARAPVTFIRADGESDNAVNSRLQTARQTAESTLESAEVTVVTDSAAGQLRFVARAPGRDQATTLAEDARTRYLTTDPSSTLTGQIEANLRQLEAEAATLRAALGEASPPTVDPTNERLRTLLVEQLAAQIQRIATLRFQLSFPALADAPAEELQAELTEAEALVDELRVELDKIPTVVAPEGANPSDLEALVLRRRLEMVQSQYIALALRLLDLQDAEGFSEPAIVSDQTPAPVSRTQAGLGAACWLRR
jgi:hypothetical protein